MPSHLQTAGFVPTAVRPGRCFQGRPPARIAPAAARARKTFRSGAHAQPPGAIHSRCKLMFRQEGEVRTARHNRMLAGYLALVAGLVNSAGFVMIGTFTSHTTGNIGRFANDLALGQGEQRRWRWR